MTPQIHREFAESFAESLLKLIEDLDDIVPERDSDNGPGQEIPPIMPKQVMGLLPRDLTTLVTKHRLRLEGTNHGGAEIAALENEFRNLKVAYANDAALKETIDEVDEDKMDFDNAWKHLSKTYGKLHEFFGGLATVFPGTATVESDFSHLKMTSNSHVTNMTDFSLESKLHAKQFIDLQRLKLD